MDQKNEQIVPLRIKNLAELKRCIRPGTELVATSHSKHPIWSRMIWKFDARRFDFQSVQLSGIQPELYSVYQAVKAISTGSRNITLADLASPELVTDEAFHLIVCALLLAKYGDVILNFEGKYADRMDVSY